MSLICFYLVDKIAMALNIPKCKFLIRLENNLIRSEPAEKFVQTAYNFSQSNSSFFLEASGQANLNFAFGNSTYEISREKVCVYFVLLP